MMLLLQPILVERVTEDGIDTVHLFAMYAISSIEYAFLHACDDCLPFKVLLNCV